ncbi:leucine-rich repeat-containing protein 15 [Anabrus simplex]|uniref:leucine-rich repeat-containing protein 15 n=1 Tax=Anabrus simplex TaxID=316456 RepID=UPI0035A3A294
MTSKATWSLVWLVLVVFVSCEEELQCGECACKLLDGPQNNLKVMELNCSATGNDVSSTGKQVPIPTVNVDYDSLQIYNVWAYFRRNNITKVQILNLELVAKLFLDENNIEVIFDNAFSNLARTLTELSVAHNNLREIRSKVFEPLKKLQVLDLSHNNIQELHFDDLNLRNSLKTLLISSNQISNIKNSGTKELSSLETLDLSANQLVNISKNNFMKLSKLSTLNLSSNKLASLQVSIFSPLTALRFLDLSHNSISTLGLSPVRSLKQLKIGDNSVTNLHKLMEVFPNLQELHIENNGIRSLNKSDKFEALRVLNLSRNELSDFPSQAFTELIDLDLSSNKFKKVPAGLNGKDMPSLRYLSLDTNPLKSVEFSTTGAPFRDLRRLRLCHLEELQGLGEQAFPWLIEPAAGYRGLDLTIAHNPHLAEVHKGALKHVRPLDKLDLSYNALTSLPMELASWENITTVDLQGNPWHCQCSLQWLLDEVVGHIYEKGDRRLLVDLRCASPAALRDRRLVHYYNWKTPALCGGEHMMGRMKKAEEVEVNLSSGSSEGMLIAVSVLGTLFLVLVIAGLVVHFRSRAKLRHRNRRF